MDSPNPYGDVWDVALRDGSQMYLDGHRVRDVSDSSRAGYHAQLPRNGPSGSTEAIGSACRCTNNHEAFSRRRTLVTRRTNGVISSRSLTFVSH
jgi:hypothetical protein